MIGKKINRCCIYKKKSAKNKGSYEAHGGLN